MNEGSVRSEYERSFPLSKDVLDTANSVCWFFMDAFWMIDWPLMSMVMGVFTVSSGIALCYVEKRRSHFFINLGIMSWILMNVAWMLSDHSDDIRYVYASRSLFAVGLMNMFLAIATSKDIADTFSHFRRFRLKKVIK